MSKCAKFSNAAHTDASCDNPTKSEPPAQSTMNQSPPPPGATTLNHSHTACLTSSQPQTTTANSTTNPAPSTNGDNNMDATDKPDGSDGKMENPTKDGEKTDAGKDDSKVQGVNVKVDSAEAMHKENSLGRGIMMGWHVHVQG